MALDAATLALCAAELDAALADSRIDKIHQPTRDEVVLAMRTQRNKGRMAAEEDNGAGPAAGRTQSLRLLLSARTGSARVCLTQAGYENPASPPSFCMLLRKHLVGGRLQAVRNVPGERIVYFDFLCTNEMGDLVENTLAAELMGRYCNLVLFRRPAAEGEKPKIIDALKRVDFEDSTVRQLLPGLAYTLPPPPPGALDFLTAPVGDVLAAVAAQDVPAPTALRRAVGGVGPVVVREVCHRALGQDEPSANSLSAPQLKALERAISDIRADHAAGGVPTLVRKADGAPAEFSFTPLTQYTPGCTLEAWPDFSALLEGYYAEKDRVGRLQQKSRELRKTVHNLYERAQRKQAARAEELAESGQSEALRIKGELLTANLHAFHKGDTRVRLHNWYDGGELEIALDARLGPSQNAQRYFREYKKKQTAAKMLAGLLEKGEKEIDWLATVLYEVDSAEGEAALGEIRAELKAQGYLRYYKPRDKRQKPAAPYRYRSSDGFTIYAGRNNTQNEQLTLKTARGKDMWFHVKNAPGSHVVVMSEGKDIPKATQNEAAMLAVWHSSQKNGAKVPVDYTQVKHIRKTGDLPPGMVLYDHYETAFVTAEAGLAEKLADGGEG